MFFIKKSSKRLKTVASSQVFIIFLTYSNAWQVLTQSFNLSRQTLADLQSALHNARPATSQLQTNQQESSTFVHYIESATGVEHSSFAKTISIHSQNLHIVKSKCEIHRKINLQKIVLKLIFFLLIDIWMASRKIVL